MNHRLRRNRNLMHDLELAGRVPHFTIKTYFLFSELAHFGAPSLA
jgi:hypothetical protein